MTMDMATHGTPVRVDDETHPMHGHYGRIINSTTLMQPREGGVLVGFQRLPRQSGSVYGIEPASLEKVTEIEWGRALMHAYVDEAHGEELLLLYVALLKQDRYEYMHRMSNEELQIARDGLAVEYAYNFRIPKVTVEYPPLKD